MDPIPRPLQRFLSSLFLVGVLLGAPALAQDPPDLRIELNAGGDIVLSWSADNSRWIEWYPEMSTDLLEGNWQAIQATPQESGGRFTVSQEMTNPSRYFRLRTPLIFVDDSNPSAGDGSLADPFRTIGAGLIAAREGFLANGRRPVVYVFEGDYPESLTIDAAGIADYRLTLMDSSNEFVVGGRTIGALGQVARLRPPFGAVGVSATGLEAFALLGFDVQSQSAHCIAIDGIDDAYLFFNELQPTGGDGYHCRNSSAFFEFPSVGVFAGNGDDGIELINDDGQQRHVTIDTGNFGFGLDTGDLRGTLQHGIKINASSGNLEAELLANFIVSQRETITTTDDGSPGSLILDLVSNSTLDTSTPGVLTQSITGSGLHSTVVRSWEFPYQVIGSVLAVDESGGLLFDRVTFDADGNPGNGFTQVRFTDMLRIGSVPPFTITRVVGPGLEFANCAGDLHIETLEVANRGAPALVNTGALSLSIGTSTFETTGN